MITCPVCGDELNENEKSFFCRNGHCFDKAKEGYVNLLTGSHKDGALIGDNKVMAVLRRDFLNKGYFSPLADGLINTIKSFDVPSPVLLDICCGEGYYSQKVAESINGNLYGFDLSKSMVRLAAKRKTGGTFFVANLSHIPIKDESVDTAFHLFAPFNEKEFSRVLKKSGYLITVVPGENHLFELKGAVYEKPYKNDEKLPETKVLTLTQKIKIKSEITLESRDDILALFGMTPYYYRTSPADKAKLLRLERLTTRTEFVLGIYKKI